MLHLQGERLQLPLLPLLLCLQEHRLHLQVLGPHLHRPERPHPNLDDPDLGGGVGLREGGKDVGEGEEGSDAAGGGRLFKAVGGAEAVVGEVDGRLAGDACLRKM